MMRVRGDAELGETRLPTPRTWQRPQMARPPQTGIDIDAELARGGQHRRADLETGPACPTA